MTTEQLDSLRSVDRLLSEAHHLSTQASVCEDPMHSRSYSAQAAHAGANARQIVIYLIENAGAPDDGKVTP